MSVPQMPYHMFPPLQAAAAPQQVRQVRIEDDDDDFYNNEEALRLMVDDHDESPTTDVERDPAGALVAAADRADQVLEPFNDL